MNFFISSTFYAGKARPGDKEGQQEKGMERDRRGKGKSDESTAHKLE